MMTYTDFYYTHVEGYCSFEQAAAYLIFGDEPKSYRICDNRQYISPFQNKKHFKELIKVLNALCDLLKSGDVTAIRPPTSRRQKRVKIINPKTWQGITATDIIHGKTSLSEALINIEQLRTATPLKEFVVKVADDGRFYVTDCKKVAIIAKTRPGYNKYEWVKFYFENPNQTITRQDMIDHFKGSRNEFTENDDMNEYVFKIFEDYINIVHRCFPTLGIAKIQFTPTFTSTDALVF